MRAGEATDMQIRTNGSHDVGLYAELGRVAAGDVVDPTSLSRLHVLRVSDLIPHIARGHEKNDDLRAVAEGKGLGDTSAELERARLTIVIDDQM